MNDGTSRCFWTPIGAGMAAFRAFQAPGCIALGECLVRESAIEESKRRRFSPWIYG
jgi:hypothetical protein